MMASGSKHRRLLVNAVDWVSDALQSHLSLTFIKGLADLISNGNVTLFHWTLGLEGDLGLIFPA